MLGLNFPPELKANLIRAEEDIKKQRLKLKTKMDIVSYDYDDYFAFIAGYTSGGFPYGITWEEAEEIEKNEFFSNFEENEYTYNGYILPLANEEDLSF
jgi:hypothetical protein